MDTLQSGLLSEIARRRTFAIISHPDAGKTTLTEKLLLFGGAIQLAGEVKARGERTVSGSIPRIGLFIGAACGGEPRPDQGKSARATLPPVRGG